MSINLSIYSCSIMVEDFREVNKSAPMVIVIVANEQGSTSLLKSSTQIFGSCIAGWVGRKSVSYLVCKPSKIVMLPLLHLM